VGRPRPPEQVTLQRQSVWPWVVVTCLVLAAELVAASLAATDLGKDGPGIQSGHFSSCSDHMLVDDQEAANSRKTWATAVLILLFLRSGALAFTFLYPFLDVEYFSSSTCGAW
jgi:hypothetical protein